ncbi:N-acetylmuramoyl-L-alanine amidase [Pleionea sp. CnH1-48]|uniref:N-acetylmuramoyl-L-alanine amidase n=1 Tax=Pleionea sp. CnH1-48 TaxID=2954494 RepID=UPI00209845DD|nr:N-acetylmuramoyl-L-alanine amidase [Pleionea sp. CnH1-48]MCO7223570.1 N-acetylmuramoyl-L-alanine amidase [Pleionea sp. CnH1-48]
MTPEYIVIHTAAFRGKNCDADTIDRWHRARGWSGIGYHFVILNNRHKDKADGTLEKGRELSRMGAHARGINHRSVGICCIGHGDYDDFTDAQKTTLFQLVNRLMTQFDIPIEKVIGHREINSLVDQGVVSSSYRTSKSCPGNKVDMHQIREAIAEPETNLSPETHAALIEALQLLEENQSVFANAQDELREFLTHPEVMEFKAE